MYDLQKISLYAAIYVMEQQTKKKIKVIGQIVKKIMHAALVECS
jgi:hypothetical protein